MPEPSVIIIDHSTGQVTPVGGSPRVEFALTATLMEQARAVKTAAVATPAPQDSAGE